MLYVGKSLKASDGYSEENCLVDPTLPVAASVSSAGPGDWPSYSILTPEQRRNFVNWMADGRQDFGHRHRVRVHLLLWHRTTHLRRSGGFRDILPDHRSRAPSRSLWRERIVPELRDNVSGRSANCRWRTRDSGTRARLLLLRDTTSDAGPSRAPACGWQAARWSCRAPMGSRHTRDQAQDAWTTMLPGVEGALEGQVYRTEPRRAENPRAAADAETVLPRGKRHVRNRHSRTASGASRHNGDHGSVAGAA